MGETPNEWAGIPIPPHWPKRFSILPIDDVPGRAFEINWTDASGEDWSEEAIDLDDAIDTLRGLFAVSPEPKT